MQKVIFAYGHFGYGGLGMAVDNNDEVKKAFNALVDGAPERSDVETVIESYEEKEDPFQSNLLGILNALDRRRNDVHVLLHNAQDPTLLKEELRLVERHLRNYGQIYKYYTDMKRVYGDCKKRVGPPFSRLMRDAVAGLEKSILSLKKEEETNFIRSELIFLNLEVKAYKHLRGIYLDFRKKEKKLH